MISTKRLAEGIVAYADNEIMPSLSVSARWIAGTFITLILSKMDIILSNEALRLAGVIQPNGMVDVDSIITALEYSARKYGKLTLSIPLIGEMSFTEYDVKSLKNYICGGEINGYTGNAESLEGSAG